jgi:hypothetical protein
LAELDLASIIDLDDLNDLDEVVDESESSMSSVFTIAFTGTIPHIASGTPCQIPSFPIPIGRFGTSTTAAIGVEIFRPTSTLIVQEFVRG